MIPLYPNHFHMEKTSSTWHQHFPWGWLVNGWWTPIRIQGTSSPVTGSSFGSSSLQLFFSSFRAPCQRLEALVGSWFAWWIPAAKNIGVFTAALNHCSFFGGFKCLFNFDWLLRFHSFRWCIDHPPCIQRDPHQALVSSQSDRIPHAFADLIAIFGRFSESFLLVTQPLMVESPFWAPKKITFLRSGSDSSVATCKSTGFWLKSQVWPVNISHFGRNHHLVYPLVNIQKTMEKHHAINGKIH